MYQEPGVYLNMNKTGNLNPPVSGGRIPLIIGEGPTILRKTVTMVRSNVGATDTLPVDAVTIDIVGKTEDVNSYNAGAGNDYVFNISSPNIITWNAGKGPDAGSTYYATLTYSVDPVTQYEYQKCLGLGDVDDFYGPDIKIDDANEICRISLAARVALKQGAKQVGVLQVKPAVAGQPLTADDYMKALDEYASFITDIWRIVPVDVDSAINAAVDAHVNLLSSSDERLERTAIYGAANTSSLTTASEVISTVGNYAKSKANSRINMIYPDSATLMLSDGKYHTVDAAIICAGFAGKEATLKPQDSRTRMTITGFQKLGGVKLKRTEMNSLAECGVMILTQSTEGADIVVRHGVTTDMSSVQNRETSITDISDTVARYLRTVCDPYIGKFNITPEVVTRVEGTINSAFTSLGEKKTIIKGSILLMLQDAENPDRLVIKCRVYVPYPCNFIDFDVDLG